MKLAVVGAGWAGLAAAVAATGAGHQVSVFEAARQLGGRARALEVDGPGGARLRLDNGQHILAGAYTQTLRLMREVGVDPRAALLALPLTLRFPDGTGLALPRWPAPLDTAWGILRARGWSWRDKAALLRCAMGWRASGFTCAEQTTVAELGAALTPRVRQELIDPLCVSALNTPSERASGQVFLRVLRDALFTPGEGGASVAQLLLPRQNLGALFPDAAAAWLARHGAAVALGRRVQSLAPRGPGWNVDGQAFDAVLLACPAAEAARLAQAACAAGGDWARQAQSLRYEGIATVYARAGQGLPAPLLALRSSTQAPAQFVFDRGQLGGPAGLLAFVVSASSGERDALQAQVVAQAQGLGWQVEPVLTVVEKRATFACTPGLRRPSARIAPGLLACGDYVDGPYPATLEGAVRSGLEAVALLQPP
ncbi:MAG TPA: hydroxysqualene dehydroxylase HpnE [Ramlibacter sp.]|nr:hydroxysqualene dehydroxylase HpnE [Ramlibacter sp.]